MPTTIHAASNAADFKAFRELVAEYEASLPEDLQIADLGDELRNIEARYGKPNVAFLAIADSTAVGCVGVTTLDESTAVIKRLYVVPKYRQAGAGRDLIVASIEFARNMQFARIVLDTDRERLNRAYRLYVALGFKECAPFSGADYACPTYMELRLR